MIDKIELELKPYRELLVNHSLYKNLKNIDDVKKFMEMHVFAVWDFMSLVKKLQIELTCVQIPWIPTKDSGSARLINEIVWGEETDVDKDGNAFSHFEMYINAMKSIKADPSKINNLINSLESNISLDSAFDNIQIDNPNVEFIRPCNLCPHMKRITLPKILDCLKNETNEIIMSKDIIEKARKSVERMAEIGR